MKSDRSTPLTGTLNIRSSEAIGEVRDVDGRYVKLAQIGSIVVVHELVMAWV